MQTQADPRPAPAAALFSPLGLLAELTHRCPLGCPYCSNPLELDRRTDELDTATWARVFREAAALGVLQVHLSGGEPAARRDLVDIMAAARDAGLYTNLITSGVGVTPKLLGALADAGLDHVQISIQDSEEASADRIAGYDGAYARKRALASEVVALKVPLTANIVIHRANIERVDELVAMALDDGRRPGRNRPRAVLRLGAEEPRGADADPRAGRAGGRPGRGAARAPSWPHRDRRRRAGLPRAVPQALRRRLGPARSLNVTPSGRVLPCHAAESIPGLEFWSVRDRSLREIWEVLARVQCIPGHFVSARAMPELRAARHRLRRLPLPGLRLDRRRQGDRPGLPSVAASPRGGGTRRDPRGYPLRLSAGLSAVFFFQLICFGWPRSERGSQDRGCPLIALKLQPNH